MNSDQAGKVKTPDDILNEYKLFDFYEAFTYNEQKHIWEVMKLYAAQFKQVEESDKDKQALAETNLAAYDKLWNENEDYKKEIERLKSKSERTDELLNRAEELLQKSFLKAKESLATNIYEFLQCLRERITQNHI